jgi:hypothetical protein
MVWCARAIVRVRLSKGCVIEGQNDGVAHPTQLRDKSTVELE